MNHIKNKKKQNVNKTELAKKQNKLRSDKRESRSMIKLKLETNAVSKINEYSYIIISEVSF